MRNPLATLLLLVAMVLLALPGCAGPTSSAAGPPVPPPAARIFFAPPDQKWLNELQQAVDEGHQSWRRDAFQVARSDLLALVREPPPGLNEEARQALKSIDAAKTETNESYQLYRDSAGFTHIAFDAPPLVADAMVEPVRPARDRPAIWITRNIILRVH